MKNTNTKKIVIGMMALMLTFGTLGNTAKAVNSPSMSVDKNTKELYYKTDFKPNVKLYDADWILNPSKPYSLEGNKIKFLFTENRDKLYHYAENDIIIAAYPKETDDNERNNGWNGITEIHKIQYVLKVDKITKNFTTIPHPWGNHKKPFTAHLLEGTLIPLSEALEETKEGRKIREKVEESMTKIDGEKLNLRPFNEEAKAYSKEEVGEIYVSLKETEKILSEEERKTEEKKIEEKNTHSEKEIKTIDKKESNKETSKEEIKKESKKENPNTGDAGSLTAVMSAVLSAVALFVSRKRK